MSRFTVTAVFESSEAALAAGEKMREAFSTERGRSEVLLPGRAPVEVEWQNNDWIKIALFGAAFGLVGTYIFLSLLGGGFWYGFAGLAAGVASGVMLGIWVSGEWFASRPGGVGVGDERIRYALESGHPVVRVRVHNRRDAERAATLMEQLSGYLAVTERPAVWPIVEEHPA